jgi:transcriptional regulator with XRE-family HTH domain
MKLRDYIANQKITPTAFAAQVGCPPSTITRLLRGERSPRLDLIRRIREVTGGAVTADDFLLPDRAAPAPEAEAAA